MTIGVKSLDTGESLRESLTRGGKSTEKSTNDDWRLSNGARYGLHFPAISYISHWTKMDESIPFE